MTDNHTPAALASFLQCLSILETETYCLYKALSEKAEVPLVKSLLFGIAVDSQKHAELLKGVVASIAPKHEVDPQDCKKRIGETLGIIAKITQDVASKKKISEHELWHHINELDVLESTAGEEYSVFVQLKTLTSMSQEINRFYNVDLNSIKSIFVSIMNDEEHHREMLESIKKLLNERKQEQQSQDPLMEYRELFNRK